MIFAELLPAAIRDAFTNKVQVIADKHSINSDWLMIVMAFETGKKFNTGAHGNGAVGLIGFRSQTATELGTSLGSLAGMSATVQLDYVDKYLTRWNASKNVKGFTDLYTLIFTPAYVAQPDNFKIGDAAGSNTQKAIYNANRQAFDRGNRGYFTKGDIGKTVADWAGYSIVGMSLLPVVLLLIAAYLILK